MAAGACAAVQLRASWRALERDLGLGPLTRASGHLVGAHMTRTWGIVVACVAVLSIAACGRSPTQPIYDGYTLHGVVLDAGSGDPLGDVHVLVGREGSEERNPYATTDANGQFKFQPAPNTAPSREVFRLEKPGYVSQEVLARSALRLGEFEYRLEVRLEPSGP